MGAWGTSRISSTYQCWSVPSPPLHHVRATAPSSSPYQRTCSVPHGTKQLAASSTSILTCSCSCTAIAADARSQHPSLYLHRPSKRTPVHLPVGGRNFAVLMRRVPHRLTQRHPHDRLEVSPQRLFYCIALCGACPQRQARPVLADVQRHSYHVAALGELLPNRPHHLRTPPLQPGPQQRNAVRRGHNTSRQPWSI